MTQACLLCKWYLMYLALACCGHKPCQISDLCLAKKRPSFSSFHSSRRNIGHPDPFCSRSKISNRKCKQCSCSAADIIHINSINQWRGVGYSISFCLLQTCIHLQCPMVKRKSEIRMRRKGNHPILLWNWPFHRSMGWLPFLLK